MQTTCAHTSSITLWSMKTLITLAKVRASDIAFKSSKLSDKASPNKCAISKSWPTISSWEPAKSASM